MDKNHMGALWELEDTMIVNQYHTSVICTMNTVRPNWQELAEHIIQLHNATVNNA